MPTYLALSPCGAVKIGIAALVRRLFGIELAIRSDERCRDVREALRRIRKQHKPNLIERQIAAGIRVNSHRFAKRAA